MIYQVYIPSVEYYDFVVARLKNLDIEIVARNITREVVVNNSPILLVVEPRTGYVNLAWNRADSQAHTQVDFSKIEQVVHDQYVIKWDGVPVDFHDDCVVIGGHIRIDFDTLEKIYQRAVLLRGNK